MKTLEELCIEFDIPYDDVKRSYNRYESMLSYYINHKIDKSKALTRDFLGESYMIFVKDIEYFEYKLLKSLKLELNQGYLLRKKL